MTGRTHVYALMVVALLALGAAAVSFNGPLEVNLADYATPNDGQDDTAGLLAAMEAAPIVNLGGYKWDFFGPLIKGESAAFGRCRIVGPVDESACQHLEEGRKTDRSASGLFIHKLKPGEYWIDWKAGKFRDGKGDRGGPIGISNTVVQINGDGCFLRLGDVANHDPIGMDARKVDLSGLYVTLPDQLAHHDFDGERLPAYAHHAVIEIVRGYDVSINHLSVRGGGTQLRLLQCDRPGVGRYHGMWCVRGIAIDSLPGNAAVEAALSDIFIEGGIGTAIDCESAQVSQVRVEVGYDAKIGRRKINADWKIAAGGSRVEMAGASDRLFAGQLVYVDGSPLRVSNVDAEGFMFDGGDSHSYFAREATGSSIEACYGVGILGRGDRFSLSQWSSDQNRDLPGLPVAAFVPAQSTMPIGPYANSRGPWIGEDNRSVIVGHCCGSQWSVEASVDYAGTIMRPDHPLCHEGIGPVPDPNWNRWLGIWAGNDESRFLRFRQLDGRWTVRLDDSKTGRRMPPARSYKFRVYAHQATMLSVYGGKGRTNEHKLVEGWQNVSGKVDFEPTMLLLGSAPVSVEL